MHVLPGEGAGSLAAEGAGDREAIFLTLLEGPFSISAWAGDVCSSVEAGVFEMAVAARRALLTRQPSLRATR